MLLEEGDIMIQKVFNIFKKIWKSNLFIGSLILIIVFLLLIDYYGLSLFTGTIDYERLGTVGEWFSNVITIVTIIVAAITIVNDKRIAENERTIHLRERAEDQAALEKEHKKQIEILSKAVYAWIYAEQDSITKEFMYRKICVSNKTGAPVFEWAIISNNNEELASSKEFGPLLPDIIQDIKVKKIDPDTSISIFFVSFDGKQWYRTGNDVQPKKLKGE